MAELVETINKALEMFINIEEVERPISKSGSASVLVRTASCPELYQDNKVQYEDFFDDVPAKQLRTTSQFTE